MSDPASAVLLGDIGGTYTRFGYPGAGGRPHNIVTFANDDFASIDDAIARYIGEARFSPRLAVLAVAGPVGGQEIALTNRSWRFQLGELAARFGIARIHAVNDFEALAWALARLGKGDLRALGPEIIEQGGAKVVLGPGTGMGVAALVPAGEGWQAVASEGGHVSFGASRDDEEAVFARLRARGPVSAEMVLSGPGLQRLHGAMNPGSAPLASEIIIANAKAGDAAAHATVGMFVRLLGRFSGGVALTFKALGGVYVTGGVATGLGELLDAKIFRQAFEAHPPYQELLRGVPSHLITCEQPGLLGCAAMAETLQR